MMNYPPVRGMLKDVFFLDHRHAEEGQGEDSVSKTNRFEVRMMMWPNSIRLLIRGLPFKVQMVKDLVMHFLRRVSSTM